MLTSELAAADAGEDLAQNVHFGQGCVRFSRHMLTPFCAPRADFKDAASLSGAVLSRHRTVKCHCKVTRRVCIFKNDCPLHEACADSSLFPFLDIMYKACVSSYSSVLTPVSWVALRIVLFH